MEILNQMANCCKSRELIEAQKINSRIDKLLKDAKRDKRRELKLLLLGIIINFYKAILFLFLSLFEIS